MARRRFKRRKFYRRTRRGRGGFRKFTRRLGRIIRRKQASVWRVPRKELSAKNAFIRLRTQYHIPISNNTDVPYKDIVLKGNSLNVSSITSQQYQSPPLWELATMYNFYHIYKSKIRVQLFDKTNSINGMEPNLPIHKMLYCFPSIDLNQELTDAAFWGWSISSLIKMNNPASIPSCHYRPYTTHQILWGGKPYISLKHQMKTKRMWNWPVKQEAFAGDILAEGGIGTIASQQIVTVEPLNKWYWHIGVIGVDATQQGSNPSGSVINGEMLVTVDSYVRLFGPKRVTQFAELT